MFYVTPKDIYTNREIAYKKQNLEHNCVLQESCKTVRRLQRSILLVKGGHCLGDRYSKVYGLIAWPSLV